MVKCGLSDQKGRGVVTIKRLTERDLVFLELLCRSFVISTEQAGKIYGTNNYHQIRLSELASRGLIKREWGYVKPSINESKE